MSRARIIKQCFTPHCTWCIALRLEKTLQGHSGERRMRVVPTPRSRGKDTAEWRCSEAQRADGGQLKQPADRLIISGGGNQCILQPHMGMAGARAAKRSGVTEEHIGVGEFVEYGFGEEAS